MIFAHSVLPVPLEAMKSINDATLIPEIQTAMAICFLVGKSSYVISETISDLSGGSFVSSMSK